MKNNLFTLLLQTAIATLGLFFGFMENSILPILVFLFPVVLYDITIQAKRIPLLLQKVFFLSTVVFSINLYWVALPLMEIGKLSFLFAYCVVILLSMALALFPTFFSYCLFHISSKATFALSRILFVGALWTIVEYLQSFMFSGFPWLSLTPALAQWTPLISPIAVTGSYLYSGILVMAGVALYESIFRKSKTAMLFVFVEGITLGILIYFMYTNTIPEGLPINIAVIQGNIEQSEKWNSEREDFTLQKYIHLTEQVLDEAKKDSINISLVLWPETALPFLLSPKSPLSQKLTSFISDNSFSLLTGSIRYGGNSPNNKRLLYNSALLYAPNGVLQSWYDKEKLVPFGEYTPLFLDTFINMANIQNAGQFTAGYDNNLLSVQNVPFGVLICYEVLFPSFAQQQVRDGANFLVTISNDAWFGYTRAAWQHLQHARLRAVEQSRYLIRATNTGISAIVSPSGIVLEKTPLFTEAMLVYPIETQSYKTVYNYIAPYILFSCILLVFLIFFMKDIKFKKEETKKIIRRKI